VLDYWITRSPGLGPGLILIVHPSSRRRPGSMPRNPDVTRGSHIAYPGPRPGANIDCPSVIPAQAGIHAT
jgi:hypothetical protein